MDKDRKIKLYRKLTNAAYQRYLAILRNHPGELVLDISSAYEIHPDALRRVLHLLNELNIAHWIGKKNNGMPVPVIPEIITFEIRI